MRIHHIARITLVVSDLDLAVAEHGDSIERAQVTRLKMPEARAIGLGVPAIAGARAAVVRYGAAAAEIELIEQPEAKAIVQPLGWAGFERTENSLSVTINCVDSALSAAFYLGLGANEVRQLEAFTRVIQLDNSSLKFESGYDYASAMDLAHLRIGILSVRLARIGSRGQAGPLRVLRGPDAELIELV